MFRPKEYIIYLELDPSKDNFYGKVTVKGEGGPIELDAEGMEIISVSSNYTYDGKKLKTDAYNEVTVEYKGKFWEDLLGPYKTGGAIVTQFEEHYARRMIPSVDSPKYKAVFKVTVKAPKDMEVIFNTLPVEEKVEGSYKVITFEPTPPMPTYILFFGVGPFRKKEKGRVRAFALEESIKDVDLSLKLAEESLTTLESLLKVEYPLKKLDLIAVPDFVYGAMENWGAMLFRESAMLYNERLPTKLLWRVAEVVAHEVVHQWFGNLVTPKSWRDIWLNESFATYLSYHAVKSVDIRHLHASDIIDGLQRDSLPSTRPIELDVSGEDVITTDTAPIIYSKGASVLGMLHRYLGETFWRVLSDYLKRYSYSNASADDFFDVLKGHWDGSEWFRSMWVRGKGHPLIYVNEDGTVETYTFSYFGLKEAEWRVPISVNGNGYIAEAGFKLEQYPDPGFFRVYFEELVDVKKEHVWKLINDYFAFTILGLTDLSSYRDIVEEYVVPEYTAVAEFIKNERILWRLGLGDGGVRVLKSLSPEDSVTKELVYSRLIQLGYPKAVKYGEELLEKYSNGDEYSIALNSYFRSGGEIENVIKNAKHEGEERVVLEAAASNMNAEEFMDYVLESIPKAKRIYPLIVITNNPTFKPEYWLREELETLKESLHKHHLDRVLLRWIPESSLSYEEVMEVLDEAGDVKARNYILDLYRAYRRLLLS